MRAPLLLAHLAALALAAGCVGPEEVVVGPFVQSVTARGGKVVAQTAGEVRCRLEVAEWDGGPLGSFVDPLPARHHVFAVDPLPPDTRHRYELFVEGSAEPVAAGALRTAPPPQGRAIRVAVVGDSGELRWWAARRQRDIARQALLGDPDLVLHLGDLVRSRGGDPLREHARAAFQPMGPLLAAVPLYPVLGNHDQAIERGRVFLELFELPAGPEGERYYSFDYGDAHFAAVDSSSLEALTPRQLEWLRDDLAAAARPWKIVFTHRPPLGAAADGTPRDPPELAALWRICLEGGAQLVLAGHRHAYVRYRPISRAGEGGPGEVSLVISGGGGAPLSRTLAPDPRVASQSAANHHLRLEIGTQRLDLEAIDLEGRILDRHSLLR